ncbi:MAG: TIGR01777 family oxidoreductase [Planctomycetales bacterium]
MTSSITRLTRRIELAAPAQFVYDWHLRPGAFDRLAPPWQKVEVRDPGAGVAEGSRVVVRMRSGPLWKDWIAEHFGIVPGQEFHDRQIRGPFAFWEHAHRVEPAGSDRCVLEDQIAYALPLGRLGGWLGGALVRNELERLFNYRHAVTSQDIAALWTQRGNRRMRVLVSGSTGLVGTALIPLLTTAGHEVVRLVRSRAKTPSKEMVQWDPEANYVDAAELEGLDAIVHLAGEPIAAGRWNPERKRRIRESRIRGTRLLCETLSHLARPPQTLVCASAIGVYGDRGDEVLTESSSPGSGFLAEVCRDWEAACEPARQKGIRVANLRMGVVLSPAGGALAKMLTPFKMGVGGVIGSGRQFMSCVALDDLVGAILHILVTPGLSGPINGVCPEPVSNREFTKTLGKVLGRPTIFPMPALAARLAFGEMADELLLASARVQPGRLLEMGYQFRCPTVESALRHVLGR